MTRKRILIVDDDPAIREMMRDVLEIEGYEILTASEGNEALQILKSEAEAPCVIILDMMMPKMNGWDFLNQQRTNEKLSRIPVIVCSAYKEVARSVRPHAIIPKPVTLPSLTSAVKALCA